MAARRSAASPTGRRAPLASPCPARGQQPVPVVSHSAMHYRVPIYAIADNEMRASAAQPGALGICYQRGAIPSACRRVVVVRLRLRTERYIRQLGAVALARVGRSSRREVPRHRVAIKLMAWRQSSTSRSPSLPYLGRLSDVAIDVSSHFVCSITVAAGGDPLPDCRNGGHCPMSSAKRQASTFTPAPLASTGSSLSLEDAFSVSAAGSALRKPSLLRVPESSRPVRRRVLPLCRCCQVAF